MSTFRSLLATPVLLLLVVASRGNTVVGKGSGDLLGRRFLCNDAMGSKLCLATLRSECHLYLEHGEGIPGEPEDKAFLIRSLESQLISGPDQLKGCVTISTESQALEYLRFFSSLKTVHLFREKIIEIYPADRNCYLVCLPKGRWRSLGLQDPIVRRTDSGFRVTRLVIKPVPDRYNVTVFRLTQDVQTDGTVREVESSPVSLPQPDLLWLGFPSYL